MKKHTLIITFISLIFLLFCYLIFSPFDNDCIDLEQSRKIIEKSKLLESRGEIQGARQGYKLLDIYSCKRSKEQNYAIERSMILGRNIHEAYKITMIKIDKYYIVHNRYPNSLENIREFIPKEFINAFNGFRYVEKDDGTVDIVTGLYGSTSFSLK